MIDKKALWRQANALKSQAEYAGKANRINTAQKAYEAALAIYEQIGVLSLQGLVLQTLGYMAERRDALAEAQAYFERALALKIAFPQIREVLLRGLASVSAKQGNVEKAKALIPQIWATTELQRDRFIDMSHKRTGDFAESLDAYDLAFESYSRALAPNMRARRVLRGHERADLLRHLGRIARKQGRYEVAWDLHARAMQLSEEGDLVPNEVQTLWSWALLERDAGHHDAARRLLRLAWTRAEFGADQIQHGTLLWEETCLWLLEEMQPDYVAMQCNALE